MKNKATQKVTSRQKRPRALWVLVLDVFITCQSLGMANMRFKETICCVMFQIINLTLNFYITCCSDILLPDGKAGGGGGVVGMLAKQV